MRLYFVPPFRIEIKKTDEKERLYYFHFLLYCVSLFMVEECTDG